VLPNVGNSSNGVSVVAVLAGADAAPSTAITSLGTYDGALASVTALGAYADGTIGDIPAKRLVRLRWKGTAPLAYGNPSATLDVFASSATLTNLPIASPSAAVSHLVVESTLFGGSEYYVVTEIAVGSLGSGSYAMNITDDALAQQTAVSTYGDFGHETPPLVKLICAHRGRLYAWAADGTLYWSRAGLPGSWKGLSYSRGVQLNEGDTPTAMISAYGDLWLLGRYSVARLVYVPDPAEGFVELIPGRLGVFSDRAVATADGTVYGFGAAGAWRLSGLRPRLIGGEVAPTVRATINAALYDNVFSFYDSQTYTVSWLYTATDETSSRRGVAYHVPTGAWRLCSYRNGIAAATALPTATAETATIIWDANLGYGWTVTIDANDGLAPGVSGSMTAASGTTASSIVCAGTVPDALGLIAYRPSTGEERLITGVVAGAGGTLTLQSALSTTPAVGEAIYIGSIRMRVVPQWDPLGFYPNRKRPDSLCVMSQADGAAPGNAQVDIYADYAASPLSPTSFGTAGEYAAGCTVNGTGFSVDLTLPAVFIPVPADAFRVARWSFTHEAPEGPPKLIAISWMTDRDQVGKKAEE
jgi:hypothetical protein